MNNDDDLPPPDDLDTAVPETPESRTLDALVGEARDHLDPSRQGSDGAAKRLEDRLFARIAEIQREAPVAPAAASDLDAARARRRDRVLQLGALAIAAAAAVALFVNKQPTVAPTTSPSVVAQAESAAVSSLRATEGAGEVRVGGASVKAGHLLRAGDVLEADNARAVLERPRKVMWLLERADDKEAAPTIARARVKGAAESLVLGLEDGAIEAQVTPVPAGEAFAVDVASGEKVVRVAVHGTHLRVARFGSKVTVDLTEGVIAIGAPPKSGITIGTSVTAPAHVEYDVNDLEGTLKIDHNVGKVRAAVSLAAKERTAVAEKDPPSVALGAPAAPKPTTPVATLAKPAPIPRPTDLPPPPAKPDPTKPVVPPREAIAAAVRDCAKSYTRPSDVRVTVTSTLRVKVAANGDIETAQFDPPLLPEIQTCAAPYIYKEKLEARPGAVSIPIEFSY